MAEEGKKESAGADNSSSKNPLLLVMVLLNIVTLGVVAFFQFKFMQIEATRPDLTTLLKEQESSSAPNDETAMIESIKKENLVPLDNFTVNLAPGDGPRRFLRLSAVLKMSEDSKTEEVEARKPQIRDMIISILNSKRPEDLLKREGKEYLKEEIKSAINSFMVDSKIVDIFYVGFQIN
jgi:flagellar FliL protein